VPDDRYTGKVRWFVKPIVFGGDAQAESNVQSVSHAQHAEARPVVECAASGCGL
jgi:hypothetical protein